MFDEGGKSVQSSLQAEVLGVLEIVDAGVLRRGSGTYPGGKGLAVIVDEACQRWSG